MTSEGYIQSGFTVDGKYRDPLLEVLQARAIDTEPSRLPKRGYVP